MDESQKYDVEGKKPGTKEYLLHESMLKFKNRAKQSLMLEVKMALPEVRRREDEQVRR